MTDRPVRRETLLVALLLTALALLTRAQTYGNPAVGFDEHWYLLVGDRMLQGQLPYVDLFDRKPVGIFLVYAGIRLLGGGGIWEYQLVATAFVAATAFVIYAVARRHVATVPAILGAACYLLWLAPMEGDGGQSPVFYNLPVALAGWLTALALADRRRVVSRGFAAMLLAGLAIQIKYNAIAEGALFGCALLWAGWRAGIALPRLAVLAIAWIAIALAPTIAAGLWFASMGHWDVWWFANFVSIFGQGVESIADNIEGLIGLTALLLPLVVIGVLAARAWHRSGSLSDERWFLILWAVVAVLWVYAFRRFGSTHYGMPALVPLSILVGVGCASLAVRRATMALALLVAAIGQYVLWSIATRKGAAETMATMVAEANNRRGCIFVFDGYPLLYYFTNSCLPTRFTFPSHLTWTKEMRPGALGIDAYAELRRVLASRPGIIIDDWPIWHEQNPAARAMLEAALKRDYVLARIVTHGSDRQRLIYRLREDRPQPTPAPVRPQAM